MSSKSNSAKHRDSAVKRSDDDITQSKVMIKGKNCWTPKEAKTNLINFIMRSDMEKRRKNINIPFFTSGCYMRVTYADPGARHGCNQFTGICIARSNKGLGSTFTLRNVIQRVGVERMFELYSPHLIEIQVLILFSCVNLSIDVSGFLESILLLSLITARQSLLNFSHK